MKVTIIETSGLGDRSYVVADGGAAVVIDPQRDIDRVLDVVGEARVTHVLETHIHNDYVTGGLELSRAVDAEYVVPDGEELGFSARRVVDGDVIESGQIRLRVIHTPGHTEHHVSYELRDGSGDPVGVFTGGSLLFGSTGRTDLVDEAETEALTRAQYRSVRRLADSLPDACGGLSDSWVRQLLLRVVGRRGLVDHRTTARNQPGIDQGRAGLRRRAACRAFGIPRVLRAHGRDQQRRPCGRGSFGSQADRNRTSYAAGWNRESGSSIFAAGWRSPPDILKGSLGFELSGSFVTYLGWLHPWGTPLTLIGEDQDQIADARRELVRIGIDDIAGAADVEAVGDAADERRYGWPTSPPSPRHLGTDGLTVLDVRQSDEFTESHIAGAVNIPLHELLDRVGELPTGEVWVHCASGYRASIAASILDSRGRDVVLIDDEFGKAEELELTDGSR